ncbi:MAG TPA: hypothetical protein VFK40_01205 [Nitrososphaeraceae archaeon]|nr:hypothetical protein [Nitrososphaeraceae archaeon]
MKYLNRTKKKTKLTLHLQIKIIEWEKWWLAIDYVVVVHVEKVFRKIQYCVIYLLTISVAKSAMFKNMK